MNYSVLYSSPTGNTEYLAKGIASLFDEGVCTISDEINQSVLDADVVFVGFWTLRGSMDKKASNWLKQFKNKQLFLFGTAGFGKSSDYFEQIINRSIQDLDPSNTLIGTFMCQGKMPESVKQKYEIMNESAGDNKTKLMLENYQEAISHPNEHDLIGLQAKVKKCLKSTE